MNELITSELVDLELSAQTKQTVSRSLAERMVAVGGVTDLEGFLADVAAREAKTHTGLEGGMGIPHCRSKHVTAPALAFGRSDYGIDFGAHDGPADPIFLKDGRYLVEGALTIRGQVRRVTLDLFLARCGHRRVGRDLAGFRAYSRISRSEFGVTGNAPVAGGRALIGDTVMLELEIQAVKDH